MPKDYSDQTPHVSQSPTDQAKKVDVEINKGNKFPTDNDQARVDQYEHFTRLFKGDHYTAFNIKIDNKDYNKAYSALRYVTVNFAGMISKIVADMLFSEPIKITVPDGDQEYLEGLWRENKMDIQCYESALSNSYKGDSLWKLRIGPRNPNDKKPTTIIEDITPNIYFPEHDDFNVRANPKKEILAWTFTVDKLLYLRQEIHTPGMIENKIYRMKGNEIQHEVGLDILDSKLKPIEQTKVDFSLLEHVVNFKTGDRAFGISDYYDLETLFYAINNRMSKVDNVLDKHTDPILMVPPGILDEKGQVRKKDLGVIEIEEGQDGKPEYIVWDASLENAFKEVEKLVEFMYMVGEVSPDVLGLGQGVSDSGRALKFKLMRTIAKVARKKLYYDQAIKNLLYKAQVFSKAHGIEIEGKKLQGEPVMPEIEWADGLPIDIHEQLEDEVIAVDAGLKSKKEAIMTLYNVDEESAEKMLEERRDETAVDMPTMSTAPNFKPGDKTKVPNQNPKNNNTGE